MNAFQIKTIVEQQPDVVAQLLAAYGYDAEPTEENLQNLVKVYGDSPLPYSNATGVQSKPTLVEKLGGIFQGLANIINRNKQAAVQVPGTIQIGTGTETNMPVATDRIFGINRTVFLVLAGLIVLAFGIMVFKKKA